MEAPIDVKRVIGEQTIKIDAELQRVFAAQPDMPMYQHLAYFMGFRNEQLEPEVVYGGKRFRSSLMLLLAEWYGHGERALPIAAALELYHNFTLLHDDIEDNDTERRGRPTVWALFGVNHAINDGDQQMILVSELLAQAAGQDEFSYQTQLCLLKQFRLVIEGQFLDFTLTDRSLGDTMVTEAAYLQMIERKTADLIVAATRGAGILSEQSAAECQALDDFGRHLGLAYQICDDTYSIWATAATTGKRNFGDIKERKKTLPILYAREHLTGDALRQLEEYFTQEAALSDADCEAVIALLDSVDTKTVMETVFTEHADAAKAAARSLTVREEQQETLCALVDSLLPKV